MIKMIPPLSRRSTHRREPVMSGGLLVLQGITGGGRRKRGLVPVYPVATRAGYRVLSSVELILPRLKG